MSEEIQGWRDIIQQNGKIAELKNYTDQKVREVE